MAALSTVGAGLARADDAATTARGFGQRDIATDGPDTSPSQTSSQTTLPRIVVTGTQTPDNNYRVDKLDSIGPLGTTDIQNTPYSIEVLPLDMIENSQAVNFKDVSKYLPLVAYQEQQGPDILRPQTRGMQGGNFQNTQDRRHDHVHHGRDRDGTVPADRGGERRSRPPCTGPRIPSGMFNFVSKRPTQNDLHEVNVSYISDSIGTAHIDFGGPIDKNGIVSYRLNALYGAGDGFVDGSHDKRALGDLGIDVRPWDSTVLELNYTDYQLVDTGYPGWFTYGQKIQLPSAPNPQQVGYGQSYLGYDMHDQISTARIKHDFNSDWHLVVGGLNQDGTRNINTGVNNLTNNTGSYTTSMGSTFAPRFVITSDTAYLDGNFSTFGIAHDLVIGTAGYRSQSYSLIHTPTAAELLLGKASIDSPLSYPYPAQGLPDPYANYDSSTAYQQGVNVNDMLRFNPYWAVRFGVSQDWFHTDNYSNKSVLTTEYASHGLSPTGSLIFNPTVNQTVYATFASALQAGDLAPNNTVNQGESLAPYRSKEYELGYKTTIDKVALTAAAFEIRRPFANIDTLTNVFEISGRAGEQGGGVLGDRRGRAESHRLRRSHAARCAPREHAARQHRRQAVRGRAQGQGQHAGGVSHPHRARPDRDRRLSVHRPARRQRHQLVHRRRVQPVRPRRPLRFDRPYRPGDLAPGGGERGGPALLVHHRSERPHRRQYREPSRAPGFAAHGAGVGQHEFLIVA